MKKVTILTSLYKASAYLDGFLENMTEQTMFNDCLLYLIDANSPENEHEIVKPYLEKYDNIKYEKITEDPGVYGCWNKMIKSSESQYITNANVDDRLFPSCIEKHVETLDNQSDIDVAYCYNAIVHEKNISYKDITENGVFNCDVQLFPTESYSLNALKQYNLPHNHPMWRRSLHEKWGYFEEGKYVSGSDWDFWLRCGCDGVKMKLIQNVLGVYYKNPEGISTKEENMERNLQEVREIREKYAN